MAKQGRGQSKTLRHYFRRDDSKAFQSPVGDDHMYDAIVVAQPVSKKRRMSQDLAPLLSKSSRARSSPSSPPPCDASRFRDGPLSPRTNSVPPDRATTPKLSVNPKSPKALTPSSSRSSNKSLKSRHFVSSKTSTLRRDAEFGTAKTPETDGLHFKKGGPKTTFANATARSPNEILKYRGQKTDYQDRQPARAEQRSPRLSPVANVVMNRKAPEHSPSATYRSQAQYHVPEKDEVPEKGSLMPPALNSFLSNSSLPSLLSQTPSLPRASGIQRSLASGQSREMPLVIPSSQSEDDLDDDTTLFIPKEDGNEDAPETLARSVSLDSASPQEDLNCGNTPQMQTQLDGSNTFERLLRKYEQESDSESSLQKSDSESLEDIFVNPVSKTPSSKPDMSMLRENEERLLRNSTQSATASEGRRNSARKSKPFEIPKPSYRFSLSSLINQSNRDAKLQQEIANAEAALAQIEQADNQAKDILPSSQGVLATVFREKEGVDNAQKLLQAIDRTGAGQTEISWSFFSEAAIVTDPPEFPWPTSAKLSHPWVVVFRDSAAREQAFFTGFAAELFSASAIPDQVLAWVFNAMICEPNESLAQAYITALKASGQLNGFFGQEQLQKALARLSATAEALEINLPVQPVRPAKVVEPIHPPIGVLRLLRFLEQAADQLTQSTRLYAIGVLARFTIDTGILRNSAMRVSLAQTFSKLVDEAGENARNEENQLLQVLPAYSPRLAKLRRQLALAFVLEDRLIMESVMDPTDKPSELDLHERIISILQETLSKVRGNVDYKALSAWIQLLDIAIDSGFAQPDRYPTRADAAPRVYPLTNEKEQVREEEAAFNARVDALSKHVNALFTNIVDGGVTHMQRTEAKGQIEILLYRLDHSVRTKPKPRKRIFASNEQGFGKLGMTNGTPVIASLENFFKKRSGATTERSELSA